MSVVDTIFKYTYACNGITTLFTIPFQYHATEDLTITLIDTINESETVLTAGIDFNWDGDILHPTGLTTAITYTSDFQLKLERTTQLTQEHDYIDNGEFLAEDHERAIDKPVMMIQELSAKHGDLRGEYDQFVIDTETTLEDHEERIEDLESQVTDIEQSLEDSGVLPDNVNQVFESYDDSGSNKARWSSPLEYVGFTERFSEIIDIKGIKPTLDYIMKMGYVAPNVSLTSNVSNALRERGDTITAMTLTAAITKTLESISEVRFYYDNSLVDTQTSGGGIPNGGSSTYAWSGSFSTTKSFKVEVDDTSVQAKPNKSATLTYSFVYPYYYGVGTAALGAGVSGLTKQIINEDTNATRSFTVNGSQKMYFAYPASYGNLQHIYDINNFDEIGSWTKTTSNITGLDGNPVSYNIYEKNAFAVAGTYSYRFQQ